MSARCYAIKRAFLDKPVQGSELHCVALYKGTATPLPLCPKEIPSANSEHFRAVVCIASCKLHNRASCCSWSKSRLLLLQQRAVSCCYNLHKEEYCCCKFLTQVTMAQCCCCCCWVLVVHFAAHENTTVADAGQYTHNTCHTHNFSHKPTHSFTQTAHTHSLCRLSHQKNTLVK